MRNGPRKGDVDGVYPSACPAPGDTAPLGDRDEPSCSLLRPRAVLEDEERASEVRTPEYPRPMVRPSSSSDTGEGVSREYIERWFEYGSRGGCARPYDESGGGYPYGVLPCIL